MTRYVKGKGESRTGGCTRATMRLTALVKLMCTTVMLLFLRRLVNFFRLSSTRTVTTTFSCAEVTYNLVMFSFLAFALANVCATRKSSGAPFVTGLVNLMVGVVLSPMLVLKPKPLPRLNITNTTVTAMATRKVMVDIVIVKVFIRGGSGMLGKVHLFTEVPVRCMDKVYGVKVPATLRKVTCYMVSVMLTHVMSIFNTRTITMREINNRVRSLS